MEEYMRIQLQEIRNNLYEAIPKWKIDSKELIEVIKVIEETIKNIDYML